MPAHLVEDAHRADPGIASLARQFVVQATKVRLRDLEL